MSSAEISTGRPSWKQPLRRFEWALDDSGASQHGPFRLARILFGALLVAYAVALLALQIRHNDLGPAPLFFLLFSVPLFSNRLGSFGRYFLPIALGLAAYVVAGHYAEQYKLGVHYTQQIAVDRHLTPGGVLPTVWLQQHLYHGHTGLLETLAVVAYASHFIVPLAVGCAFVVTRRIRSFHLLMFSILSVSAAATIVFVLVPTAPPWLADQEGYVTGVHHILKQALYDLHMTSLAAAEGNAKNYDITAAAPSLHTAFPLLCLLAARYARLPRPVVALLTVNLLVVVFSIVYTGEHYVFDAVAGAAFACGGWLVVQRLERLARDLARPAATGQTPAPDGPAAARSDSRTRRRHRTGGEREQRRG